MSMRSEMFIGVVNYAEGPNSLLSKGYIANFPAHSESEALIPSADVISNHNIYSKRFCFSASYIAAPNDTQRRLL